MLTVVHFYSATTLLAMQSAVIATATIRASEKKSIIMNGNRPRAFQIAITEVRTLPLVAQRVAQKVNLSFL